MSHLDELFEKIFQEKLGLLEQEWVEFRVANGHWKESKVYKEKLYILRQERNEMAKQEWEGENNTWFVKLSSEFKEVLFEWFKSSRNDYNIDPVYFFMQEVYPKLKDIQQKSKHGVLQLRLARQDIHLSQFLNFSEEEVVKRLAHREAVLKFIEKLEVE